MDKLKQLEAKLGYQFKSQVLLKQALTHRSYSRTNNERLEFVGDGVLDYAIAIILYNKYRELKEGVLSKMRASLVNQDTLSELANEINLGDYIFIGDGEEKSGGRYRPSILADCMEAIFAAVSIDSTVEQSLKLIERTFSKKLDNADKLIDGDSKSILQEYLQARQITVPNYHLVGVVGPDHDSIFKVECVIEQLQIKVLAEGKSKKEASQVAASQVLEILNERALRGKAR
jgi:ribonuclease-3